MSQVTMNVSDNQEVSKKRGRSASYRENVPHHSSQKTVAVIGAGIVGICCAINLQKAGFAVTLIDRKGVAQECSKGNAGHFATEQVFPLADFSLLPQLPGMLLREDGPVSISSRYLFKALPWFARFLHNMLPAKFKRNTRALKSLNFAAISAYDGLLKEAGLEQHMIKAGSLLTFESTSAARVAKIQQQFSAQGVAVELLSKTELKELEPDLSDKIQCALLFTDVAHTPDPEQLCIALYDYFLSLGGAFVQQSCHSLKAVDSQWLLRMPGENMLFDKAVVAAGAWSKCLLTPLGYKVPLDTERGYHLMMPEHNKLSRPVASYERKMIMTPMAKGLRLAGTVEFAGLKAQKNERRAQILKKLAVNLMPDLASQSEQGTNSWMGMRPSLPDSLPVLGSATHHKNLFLAFGHQHLGLTQGAITGKLINQLVTGDATEIDLSPFCISRFN